MNTLDTSFVNFSKVLSGRYGTEIIPLVLEQRDKWTKDWISAGERLKGALVLGSLPPGLQQVVDLRKNTCRGAKTSKSQQDTESLDHI